MSLLPIPELEVLNIVQFPLLNFAKPKSVPIHAVLSFSKAMQTNRIVWESGIAHIKLSPGDGLSGGSGSLKEQNKEEEIEKWIFHVLWSMVQKYEAVPLFKERLRMICIS
jgi:hypothetical protein